MAETHKGFGLLFEMGCGKTLTAIMIAGTAYQMGKVEKVLVVAPTSVCSVWPKDFAEFADFKANIKVLLGDKNRRLKLLNDLDNFPFKALKVAVINYESTWREGIFDALYEWNADMIICDESQRIKSHDAEQSKAMHKLGDQAKYKLILSGTPVQNNAIDLYSQYRFLDPTIFGTNFYQFRNRYAIMGGFNRHQIVGYKDLDQLIQKEHSIAYRVTKDEALDLPEQTFLQRYITMSAKEKNIYDRIKRESFAELESGGQISAMDVPGIMELHRYVTNELMNEKHNVFMWTIDKYLPQTEEIMSLLGYKLHARLIWDKGNGPAPAYTVRFAHEYLLWFYKKGNIILPDKDKRGAFSTVLRENSKRHHSQKPECAYQMLETFFPQAKKLELFARAERDGWDQWGNEL